MIAFVRVAVAGFLVLTVFYVLIGIYVRSLRRERLEKDWEEQGRPGRRDDFVKAGMSAYNASLRPKLLLGVYIIPAIVIGVIIYVVNDY